MRDYHHIDRYLNELRQDIYVQPPDPWHTQMTMEAVNKFIAYMPGTWSVLDVGCGQGFSKAIFAAHSMVWTGVTLGEDYKVAKEAGLNVLEEDFSFLPMGAGQFDLIFSRHSLEHSPMPLLTLMEWWRVGKKWLFLILPTPSYWLWGGRNHYGMLEDAQAKFLLDRAGWRIVKEDNSDLHEYRYLCEHYDRE